MSVDVREDNVDLAKAEIRAAYARALERIGMQAEGYAQDLCPVDTGNLRNSITHTTDGTAAYIGTNVEYAPYVELGTRRAAAQPFLKPAATDHRGTYANIVKDELGGK
jgi:HK97 gp10 family phage protein